MNKDVIYIDVDDDVTAIIGKIKKSKEKIVAVVPPKRAGALQSAVNLRLLDRMAKADKKQLVVITNNQALIALAANAAIPVAKNLQTKPEIADVPALSVDDGDNIIDGSELPVGDHAASVKSKAATQSKGRSEAMDEVSLEDEDGENVTPVIVAGAGAATAKKAASIRSKVKIPNFDKFRKRMFLAIGGGVALVALLIWMFVFAPSATVVITAQTTPAPVSATVKLDKELSTDFSKGIVKYIAKQDKEEEKVEFDATGQKDVGDKASGTLELRKLTQSDVDIPAGSKYTTSDGKGFITQTDVTIPASVPCFPTYCAQTVDVAVKAESGGTSYNDVSGSTNGPKGTTGTFKSPTSGGTSKIAKVVSADDIERAKGQLVGDSTDAKKAELISQFKVGEKVIDSSFTVSRGKAVSSPAVDEEAPASGKATLTIETTYSIYAIPESELNTYLEASITTQIDANTQRIYDTGINEVGLSDFQKEGKTLTVSISATGRVGPKIDEQAVKEQVKGKIYGDVQSSLESLQGIKDVDVKFSFFWVRTVPNDTNKIHIEFKLENE